MRPVTTALDYPGSSQPACPALFPVPDSPFLVQSNAGGKTKIDTWGTAATIRWLTAKAFVIQSTTSVRGLANDAQTDIDATPAFAADVFIQQDHTQASQGIQVTRTGVGRWDTTAGAFFFYSDDHEFDGTNGSAKGFSVNAKSFQRSHSSAAYGQTTGRFTNRLSVTLGLRYSFDRKAFGRQAWQYTAADTPPCYNLYGGLCTGQGAAVPSGFPGNGGVNAADIPETSADWSAWTPRLSVQHLIASDTMLYASVARGFKSGGFNGRASTLSSPHSSDPYNPEYVWTYEAGARTTWLRQRLSAGLTYFYNDYRNLQLQTFVVPSNGAVFESLFTNAGKAVTKGFEADLALKPTSRLSVAAGVGFTDAAFVTFLNNGVNIASQRSSAERSEMDGNVSGSYVFHSGQQASHSLQVATWDIKGPGTSRSAIWRTSTSPDMLSYTPS